MFWNNLTEEYQCERVNRVQNHPFFSEDFRILYEKPCDSLRQYIFKELVDEDGLAMFVNGSLEVPALKQAVQLFSFEQFCFEHFEGQPGVLACVDKEQVREKMPARWYISGKFQRQL